MAKCQSCGKEFDEGTAFCPACGKKQSDSDEKKTASETASEIGEIIGKFNETEDTTSQFDQSDIENNKVMGILAYLSILVLIPIFGAPNSKFARFHANQGLVLFIAEIIWSVASALIIGIVSAVLHAIFLGFVATIIAAVLRLVNLVFLVLMIVGIINVVNGRAKQLPVIGGIQILK